MCLKSRGSQSLKRGPTIHYFNFLLGMCLCFVCVCVSLVLRRPQIVGRVDLNVLRTCVTMPTCCTSPLLCTSHFRVAVHTRRGTSSALFQRVFHTRRETHISIFKRSFDRVIKHHRFLLPCGLCSSLMFTQYDSNQKTGDVKQEIIHTVDG